MSLEESIHEYTALCNLCGKTVSFRHYGGSLRESYRCSNCNSSLRYRGQAAAILDCFGNGLSTISQLVLDPGFQALKIYEPGRIGPFRKFFKDLPNYEKSFYRTDIALGTVCDGVVNRDLQNLDIESESLDLVISSDIFEHIRQPEVAFGQVHRVLKKGGYHIFTVPLASQIPEKTVKRVDTSTDEDIAILPFHYHGDGAKGRALVYTDFGQDLIETLAGMGMDSRFHKFSTDDGLESVSTVVCRKV